MITRQQTLQSLLDRAAADPDLLTALTADPLGTAGAGESQMAVADLRQLLGVPSSTDTELFEIIRARVVQAASDEWLGCGG